MNTLLLISVFVVSTCGLVYELISGTLASYLLGDSITQFSTVIGVYLFSMGIGSYLSGKIEKNLLRLFIIVEFLIGLVGGTSSAILFLSFERVSSFRILLYFLISLTGILVGLEIPLMMRILQEHFKFKDLVAKIFTFDYIGALFASLLFPLLLVPHLGLIRSSFFFGILNVVVALWTLFLVGKEIKWAKALIGTGLGLLSFLIAGFALADRIMSYAEVHNFPDPVVFSTSSAYQRIVFTKKNQDLRLYLNNNLQFSSKDEYRYHEALVHVGLQAVKKREHILILGGGDGMALREVLKYPEAKSITLVDLDPEVTKIFSTHPDLLTLNEQSLLNLKLTKINADAFSWLRTRNQEPHTKFDFIIVDFPDPSNFSLGKLYSTTFYRELLKQISPDGAIAIQSTSPFVARKSYWCIENTLRSVGFVTRPYHAYVPAFGEWGFVLASLQKVELAKNYLPTLKFVSTETVAAMMNFPEDMARVPTEINRLNNQALVQYFDHEWADYAQ